MAVDRRMLIGLGYGQSRDWMANCGIEASLLVRQHRSSAAARLLETCANEHAPAGAPPLEFEQARAELAVARNDSSAAGSLLATLRKRYTPKSHTRRWQRPWMLSLQLARRDGSADESSRLANAVRAVLPARDDAEHDYHVLRDCLAADAASDACEAMP